MSTYVEMQKLATNPGAISSLASYLMLLKDAGWTDWEINFLDNMSGWAGPDPISTRQREKLIELRDDAKNYSTFDGFSVGKLVRECWLARLDLDEDDEQFIMRIYERGASSLKRRPLLRLLRCSRKLQLIEGYVSID